MELVDRIFTIVERLAGSRQGETLSELPRATNLPPPTMHRLLSSLADCHIVERDELSKRWRPGLGLLRIAVSLNGAAGASEAATDRVLHRMHDRWGECFFIAVLSEGQAVCVRVVGTSAPHRVSVSVPLGRRLVLHASASAKAILAQLPATEAEQLLSAAPLAQFTDKTLTSLPSVLADLRLTDERGYATCDEEIEPGVLAYAVPIHSNGAAPRSLGVIGPRERLLSQAEDGLVESLVAGAHDLAMLTPRD